MDLSMHAAYHGTGWKSRDTSMDHDVTTGNMWAPYQVNAEWGKLEAVVLYLPSPLITRITSPNEVLHLRSIDYIRLERQYNAIAHCYEQLGIQIHSFPSGAIDDLRFPNFIFQRDVFWQTQEGAVISRMAHSVRAGEEVYISELLSSLHVPITLTMGHYGTLEGADCLWVHPSLVVCGVGKRTNRQAYEMLRAHLAVRGIECIALDIPSHIQHLLGCIQIVAPYRVLVRVDIVSPTVISTLHIHGCEVIPIHETTEVSQQLAFNFVVVDVNSVVMPDDTPEFRRTLSHIGIDVVACVPITEYRNAAGGLGCATGILARTLVKGSI